MTENKTASDYRDEAQAGEMQVEQAVNRLTLEETARHKASGYTQERDFVNQLLARAQFAQGLAKVLTVTSLQDLRKIKEQKLYQSLSGSMFALASGGNGGHVTTWAEFCEILGFSREHIDEQLRNLDALGADALESMNRIGLGYRDLRKLRKLSENEQQVIVGEIEANLGDKEAIVALIDDMAAKHVKETDALKAELEGAKADLEAKDRFVAKQSQEINKLSTRLNRAPTPDEHEKEERDWMNARHSELVSASMECSRAIARIGDVISAIRQYQCEEGSLSLALLEDIPAQVSAVAQDLRWIADTHKIELDLDEILMPALVRQGATADESGEME